MSETSSLNGLRVLVTAGGSGIGYEVARQFAASGARVHVCDVVQEHLDRLKQSPGISGTLADVSDVAAVGRLFKDVSDRLGGLDVLMNNAGIPGPMGPVEDVTPADLHRIFAVNVYGMFHCLHHAVPMLKAAGGGLIVNTSSAAGRMGFGFRTPYAASKWAVVGLTKSLSIELGPHNIRVNAILPGIVSGARHDRNLASRAAILGITPEELHRQRMTRTSLGRLVSASDVAATVLFLASPGGYNISGQSLSVCGDLESMP
jgi:NAD(P)-dependent dehydrogenase (short-subunit alcohol dehydrogenase family)